MDFAKCFRERLMFELRLHHSGKGGKCEKALYPHTELFACRRWCHVKLLYFPVLFCNICKLSRTATTHYTSHSTAHRAILCVCWCDVTEIREADVCWRRPQEAVSEEQEGLQLAAAAGAQAAVRLARQDVTCGGREHRVSVAAPTPAQMSAWLKCVIHVTWVTIMKMWCHLWR